MSRVKVSAYRNSGKDKWQEQMGYILVIGAGSIGRRHIQCLLEMGVGDVLIAEPAEKNRLAAEKDFDVKESFADIDQALERDYEGVVVAVPNFLHREVGCKVIDKKLNLLLEKPIEIALEPAVKIAEAVKSNGVVCLVGYCLRFEAGLREIFEIIGSGRLGKIYSVDVSTGHYLPAWRPGIDYRLTYSSQKAQGGGVCLDLSHEFDYFRWLFGEAKEVLSVARKVSDLEIDVEDLAECIITTESGIIGRVHLDYLSRVPDRRLSINGSEGKLEYDLNARKLKTFYEGDDEWKIKEFDKDRNLMYKGQLGHFIDCVQKGTEPLITADDAIKTLELALRVRSSFDL